MKRFMPGMAPLTASLTALISVSILFSSNEAFALVTLKQVEVNKDSQIELSFDSKINPKQVQIDYFKDIIQVSLSNVSVYPAKITSINGNLLKKIFTYQYSPNLVRCRLTINGDAENFKNKVHMNSDGNMLTLKFKGSVSDKLITQASKSNTELKAPELEKEETALLEKVTKEVLKPTAAKAGTPLTTVASAANSSKDSDKLKSPAGVLLKLIFVLGIFLCGIYFLKRFMQGKTSKLSGAISRTPIGKFMQKNFGAQGRMVEVLANHYLGPKKNIAVVKVAGRVLVLGVTDDSVNLITELPSEDALELTGNSEIDAEMEAIGPLSKHTVSMGAGAVSAKKATSSFSSALNQAQIKTPMTSSGPALGAALIPQNKASAPTLAPATMAKIKSKLEGMKPL